MATSYPPRTPPILTLATLSGLAGLSLLPVAITQAVVLCVVAVAVVVVGLHWCKREAEDRIADRIIESRKPRGAVPKGHEATPGGAAGD